MDTQNHHHQQQQQTTSASSSPSHEFSFTISLHDHHNTKAKAPSLANSFAIDLSPADDIFFHGHLLPLHLLSHFPVSPRSSTNSTDGFTLPIKEFLADQKPNKDEISSTSNGENDHSKSKSKTKSFSLFRWRKGFEAKERDEKEKQKANKLRFEVLKRYLKMVRTPLLFFKGRSKENLQFHRQQPYSFSGDLSSWRNDNNSNKKKKKKKKKQESRGRGGELYSEPASMRTSPTNSGLLVATATIRNSSSSVASDSTMEELQAAIQAAIAHCKNSIAAAEEKIIKC